MRSIIEIIESIDGPNIPNINPTVIYNEGWMTRILINQSIKENTKLKDKTELYELDFGKISNWTSEALISSPFVHANIRREGYTHADMALGDFEINYELRGELIIPTTAKIFGIIEAKMGSNLSIRVNNADHYNQASRTLACIASQTYNKDCRIFFMVVAPATKLLSFRIDEQIYMETMIQEIEARFNAYPVNFRTEQNMDLIIAKARTCKVWSISYEKWINSIVDPDAKKYLLDFYTKTLHWNRIR